MVAKRRRVVLQARTSSTRLPGKVLLQICGLPIVVLAARRAANRGIETIVATSNDPSDDRLAEVLTAHNVPFMRGPLDDVLARYISATADLDDTDICVRLTSDNVFPDGDFVEQLVSAAEQSPHGHAGFSGGSDGLPYGLAGEAMRVVLLREAARNTSAMQDREHVTPWIIRKFGLAKAAIPRPWGSLDFSYLRCTIDTLDDYRNVSSAMARLDRPASKPWPYLCSSLAQWVEKTKPFVPARIVAGELQASLVLGTVQFGLNYGIANTAGKPDDSTVRAILDLANAHGLSHLDTAIGYGDSETRMGRLLDPTSPLAIITKLPPDLLNDDPSTKELMARSRAAIDRSLSLLLRDRLDAVLLHRFAHYRAADGAIWRTLVALRQEGKIGRIGCSIYSPEELMTLLHDQDVGLVQLPFNILDGRWLAADVQRAIAQRPDVILHGRSALLQGLLGLGDPARWPCDRPLAERCVSALADLARSLGRRNVIDLCFAYARAQPWLAGIVVGAETAAQMAENIELFRTPVLTPEQLAHVAEQIPADIPSSLLDPSQWQRA